MWISRQDILYEDRSAGPIAKKVSSSVNSVGRT
jgi:hypothetical protein